MLVWLRLKELAYSTGQSVYQLKHGLLSNYLIARAQASSVSHVLGLIVEMRSALCCLRTMLRKRSSRFAIASPISGFCVSKVTNRVSKIP
jgi:hypothetical protein